MIFNDRTTDPNEEMDTIYLIVNLLIYSKKLEETIIELRKNINELTPEGLPKPFFELHSDIYESFEDCRAYDRNRELIELILSISTE